MLTLTDSAQTEIRNMIAGTPEVPEDGGLRIAANPDGGTLSLTLEASPGDKDTVLELDGARVFLETVAAQVLDDRTLDADVDSEGSVQFALQA